MRLATKLTIQGGERDPGRNACSPLDRDEIAAPNEDHDKEMCAINDPPKLLSALRGTNRYYHIW